MAVLLNPIAPTLVWRRIRNAPKSGADGSAAATLMPQGPGKVAGTRLQTPDFRHRGKEILYLAVP
jgi:hypothetical protein